MRDRYVLETRLGSGGMGTVFKAVDRYRCDLPQASRIVAIKFLHEAAGHPEIVSKLRREFYCAQALSHPNIVKVYELDRDGDVEFFTMEFLDGELLSGVVEKLQPMPLSRPRAWAIIREVAAGLAHAHSRNVVHGDLKPQNIMITNSGETRILDFGASSAEIAQKSTASAMTPAYASCELLEGQGADPRDDLYALACLSYELLAGRHPFQRRRSTAARDLELVAQRPRGLTRTQWRILKLGLGWRREDRSMAVADWIAGLRPAATAARRVRPQSVIGIALAVVIAAAAMAVLYHRQPLEHKTLDGAAVSPTAADGSTAPDPADLDSSAPTAPASPGTTTGAAASTAPAARAFRCAFHWARCSVRGSRCRRRLLRDHRSPRQGAARPRHRPSRPTASALPPATTGSEPIRTLRKSTCDAPTDRAPKRPLRGGPNRAPRCPAPTTWHKAGPSSYCRRAAKWPLCT